MFTDKKSSEALHSSTRSWWECLRSLANQQNGYGQTGIHCDTRRNPAEAFKVLYMAWCVFPVLHPLAKYSLTEKALMQQMCTMDPNYDCRPRSDEVVFSAGDVRSTLDEKLLQNASDVRAATLEVQSMRMRMTHRRSCVNVGCCTELQTANSFRSQAFKKVLCCCSKSCVRSPENPAQPTSSLRMFNSLQ